MDEQPLHIGTKALSHIAFLGSVNCDDIQEPAFEHHLFPTHTLDATQPPCVLFSPAERPSSTSLERNSALAPNSPSQVGYVHPPNHLVHQ